MQEELGDLLFSMAQLCRHLNMDPEETLRMANKKFIKRFHIVEDLAREQKINMKETEQSVLEEFWQQAKEKVEKVRRTFWKGV